MLTWTEVQTMRGGNSWEAWPIASTSAAWVTGVCGGRRSEARSAGADLVLSSNDGADNLVSWVRVYLASRPVREMPNGPAPGQDTIHQNLIEDHSWAEDGLA